MSGDRVRAPEDSGGAGRQEPECMLPPSSRGDVGASRPAPRECHRRLRVTRLGSGDGERHRRRWVPRQRAPAVSVDHGSHRSLHERQSTLVAWVGEEQRGGRARHLRGRVRETSHAIPELRASGVHPRFGGTTRTAPR